MFPIILEFQRWADRRNVFNRSRYKYGRIYTGVCTTAPVSYDEEGHNTYVILNNTGLLLLDFFYLCMEMNFQKCCQN